MVFRKEILRRIHQRKKMIHNEVHSLNYQSAPRNRQLPKRKCHLPNHQCIKFQRNVWNRITGSTSGITGTNGGINRNINWPTFVRKSGSSEAEHLTNHGNRWFQRCVWKNVLSLEKLGGKNDPIYFPLCCFFKMGWQKETPPPFNTWSLLLTKTHLKRNLLLMEKILHHLGCIKPCK